MVQHAVDVAVGVGQFGQERVHIRVRARDQFKQRFRVVGRDVFVGQRRTQAGRMRGAGQDALLVHAQAFFFDASQRLGQQRAVGL
ncbi:hypothetical protein G6F57_020618 [Rhizopus arrhizus]|nr:hypothetical protein G6F57_020618 [Rhizopus arrhizus]KAG1578163.1 hypothetical protein G6F46_015808 [Rhizopus delemar]